MTAAGFSVLEQIESGPVASWWGRLSDLQDGMPWAFIASAQTEMWAIYVGEPGWPADPGEWPRMPGSWARGHVPAGGLTPALIRELLEMTLPDETAQCLPTPLAPPR